MRIRILRTIPALAAALLVGIVIGCGGGDTGQETTQESAESANPTLEAAVQKAEIGKRAPDFVLTDLDGRQHRLSDYKGRVVVLEWFNPDCPFVQRHHRPPDAMAALAEKYAAEGVVWLAVNSTHSMDREASRRARAEGGLPYPVLVDQDGAVGRAYGARTTPHMFVIDGAGEIVYAGAIDSDPRGGAPEVRNYVDAALGDLLAGRPVAEPETKPYGCSVKYAK